MYIAYYQTIESSGYLFSEDYDYLKNQWYFGCEIFDAGNITEDVLRANVPKNSERGTILKYLRENCSTVGSYGTMLNEM